MKPRKTTRMWNEWFPEKQALVVLLCTINDENIIYHTKKEAEKRYPRDPLSRYKVTVTVEEL